MKKLALTLLACLTVTLSFAGSVLIEGFEYANNDFEKPVGWICDDDSWLCGYLEKDNNRLPHSGNWYAFSNAEDSWMFMPMYLLESMHYRFTLWAISDGSFQLELWAGNTPSPEAMQTQFSSTTISSGNYEKVSIYAESIPAGCQYFAIRALAADKDTYLTIDDIEIDMVEQYSFSSEAITGDTVMYPGSEAAFRFFVHNDGYDAVSITMHPSNEFFTNFSCFFNCQSGMTIPTEPDETVEVTMVATLRPEIEPGTVAWLDILMTIPCNCNTSMVTFWVTPLDLTQTIENKELEISVFPNPTSDFVTVEAEGLEQVILTDMTGKTLNSTTVEGNSVRLDVSDLKTGVYLISAKTRSTSSLVKPILKM